MEMEIDVKHTKISKHDLITEAARQLGKQFTIADVEKVYKTFTNIIDGYLQTANDDNIVSCNLGNGLSLTAKIKQVNGFPRIWYHAKFSRYHNRQINELD